MLNSCAPAHVDPPRFDYVSAYVAAGLTPEQAREASARVRRLAKRVAKGQVTLEMARQICGVATLMAVGQ